MHNEYDIFWEHFSDQLSCLLDIVAQVENLHPDTVERIHVGAVELYRANLKILVGTGALPSRSLPRPRVH